MGITSLAISVCRYQMRTRSCPINSRLHLYKSWKNEVKSCHTGRVTHQVLSVERFLWESVFPLADLYHGVDKNEQIGINAKK